MKDKQFELVSEDHISNQKREFSTQIAKDSLFLNSLTLDESHKEVETIDRNSPFFSPLYNKYKHEIYPSLVVEKLKRMISDKIVVYEVVGEDTKFATDLLIEMLGSKGINNTIDSGRPRLFYNGHYFEVGTEFRLKDGGIMTKDKSNFGFRFKDGKVVSTLNWIDLD